MKIMLTHILYDKHQMPGILDKAIYYLKEHNLHQIAIIKFLFSYNCFSFKHCVSYSVV